MNLQTSDLIVKFIRDLIKLCKCYDKLVFFGKDSQKKEFVMSTSNNKNQIMIHQYL